MLTTDSGEEEEEEEEGMIEELTKPLKVNAVMSADEDSRGEGVDS